jgi:hypothetical protein
VAFSPQANYTDWATATFRRNLVPTFADREESRGQRGGSPTVVNLSFLDRIQYQESRQNRLMQDLTLGFDACGSCEKRRTRDDTLFRNVGSYKSHVASYPRRLHSSKLC